MSIIESLRDWDIGRLIPFHIFSSTPTVPSTPTLPSIPTLPSTQTLTTSSKSTSTWISTWTSTLLTGIISSTQTKICIGLLITGVGLGLGLIFNKMYNYNSIKGKPWTRKTIKYKPTEEVENTLDKISLIYAKYVNDPMYVYKMCNDGEIRWIVVLQKLNDTITTERFDEKNILKHVLFRKYRADKLHVVEIFDADHPTITTESITHQRLALLDAHNNQNVVYTVDKDVYPDEFDTTSKRCSNGIHYLKSVEGAYYYGSPHVNYTGAWFSHTDAGYLYSSGHYTNGYKDGVWTFWFIDHDINEYTEQIMIPHKKITFVSGRQNGNYIEYHDGSLQKSIEYTTHESICVGSYKSWFYNGNVHIEGEYDHTGQKRGNWYYFNITGKLVNKVTYPQV